MCFHYKQTKKAIQLEMRFDAKVETEQNIASEHFNGFTNPKTPIISNMHPSSIVTFSWGLIPFWAKDKTIQKHTLNARIETLTELPSFKACVSNRCLILVDGFFEWKWLDEKGKGKQQYLITVPNNEAFAFAGIYSQWTNKLTGENLDTYSIITTEGNLFMADINNHTKRMPVILTPENERLWLGGDPIMDFAKPELELIATPIYK